ncbi:MAG TPA: trypsin-like serine protease [Actinomycetota bacterium]|jgi:secreted trypsin-like serine protease|nr:trypsin-like serine protease [Actinomycetota bacterium]
MKRLLLFLTTLLSLTLLPTPAGAIAGGEVDTGNDYPFVGLLAFYDAEGEYMHRCTGTLVSPTVVLTAGHCTDGAALAYAYFDVTVPEDFRENPTGISGTPYTSPDYDPNTLSNDVGVVVLDKRVRLSEYPTIASEGFLSDLKAAGEIQDDVFVSVGYGGVPGSPPSTITFDLVRRFTESPYGGLNQNNLHLQANPNATGTGGTCFGDSGGPQFWEDTLMIVSVTSWGDAICRSNDMTQRIDIASVLAFLAEFGIVPA